MSKTLVIGPYTAGGAGFPVKSGTWDFIQQAHKEDISNLIIGLIGSNYSTSTGYILWGMMGTVSPGAIFFNGEVYPCDGYSGGACGGGGVLVLNVGISNYTDGTKADPVVLTDSSSRNVHNIRKAVISCGASGSGSICDFADLLPIRINPKNIFSTSATETLTFFNPLVIYNRYASSGTLTVNLTTAGAMVGVVSKIVFDTGYSNTISVAVAGGQQIVVAGNTTGTGKLILEAEFLGNDGTHDIFAVSLLGY